jgi:hypothetical protein
MKGPAPGAENQEAESALGEFGFEHGAGFGEGEDFGGEVGAFAGLREVGGVVEGVEEVFGGAEGGGAAGGEAGGDFGDCSVEVGWSGDDVRDHAEVECVLT